MEPAPLRFVPGQVFAGRFTIIEKVGEGGMGVVYKAIDTVLQGEVALKLVRPVLATMPEYAERFRREVRLTRQIAHPNVCRVHDIGEAGGILYLSMEWVEGETLQQLLRKAGRLKESRALEIAEKIALALEAAHEQGIIHRDLKPGNVMIDARGQVHVMDFGLAMERGAGEITGIGVVVGSPYYMAPEQATLREVDHRADFYSLGLILRELLLGFRPDFGPGLPSGARAALNPLIVTVLDRLLAEDREQRYTSAAEVRRAIRALLEDPGISTMTPIAEIHAPSRPRRRAPILWIAAAVVVVVVSAAVAWILWAPSSSDGNAQAMAFYKEGLHYLNEGPEALRSIDDAIQMFNRALDRSPDSALYWAALAEAHWIRFRRNQTELSRSEAERAAAKAYQLDPALPEVLNARAMGFIAGGMFHAARADLEKALKVKPDLAKGWANLGIVHRELGNYAAGLDAQRKAVELEPASWQRHNDLGKFYEHFSEYDHASEEYGKATELKPDSSVAWSNLGAAFLYMQRFEEAVAAFQRSLKNEATPFALSNLGTAYYFLGRYPEAEEQYRRATNLEPTNATHWGNLGDVLVMEGKTDEARGAYLKAAQSARERAVRQPLDPGARMDVALYCARAGDAACALKEGDAAAEMQPDNATILFVNAVVRCVLGRDDESLDWLERAVKHGVSKAQIGLAPEFGRFRDNPRFKKILETAS